VKASVQRVVILLLAVMAHAEMAHGGVRPVIGDVSNDGETWATVSAVDERVSIAAVFGIQQFSQAVRTGGDVWRDELIASYLLATLPDHKGCIASERTIFDLDAGYPGHRWRVVLQLTNKAL